MFDAVTHSGRVCFGFGAYVCAVPPLLPEQFLEFCGKRSVVQCRRRIRITLVRRTTEYNLSISFSEAALSILHGPCK